MKRQVTRILKFERQHLQQIRRNSTCASNTPVFATGLRQCDSQPRRQRRPLAAARCANDRCGAGAWRADPAPRVRQELYVRVAAMSSIDSPNKHVHHKGCSHDVGAEMPDGKSVDKNSVRTSDAPVRGYTDPCWNCGAKEKEPPMFCHKCDSLQKCWRGQYFELMFMPKKYDIDVVALEQKYKSLQRKVHPDKYARRPETEQQYSAEFAAELNQAYDTLKDPVARARYLLGLHGYDNASAESDTIDDPVLLMEIMELREEIEEADVSRLKALQKAVDQKMEELQSEVTEAFREPVNVKLAVRILNAMTYLQTAERSIHERLPVQM